MLDLDSKIILVDITVVSETGDKASDVFFGKVKCFNENTVVIYRPDFTEKELPYDESLYVEADEGVYELEDGSYQENPDYIAQIISYESEKAFEKYREEYI